MIVDDFDDSGLTVSGAAANHFDDSVLRKHPLRPSRVYCDDILTPIVAGLIQQEENNGRAALAELFERI
jgi:hypothetical protein